MKNIVIIGGTKGIGKAIVSEVVDSNNVFCLSRNKTDFNHDNYTFHNFDALVDDYPDFDSVDWSNMKELRFTILETSKFEMGDFNIVEFRGNPNKPTNWAKL